MKLEKTPGGYALYKEKTIIGTCQARPTEQGADITDDDRRQWRKQ